MENRVLQMGSMCAGVEVGRMETWLLQMGSAVCWGGGGAHGDLGPADGKRVCWGGRLSQGLCWGAWGPGPKVGSIQASGRACSIRRTRKAAGMAGTVAPVCVLKG
jgi:hypothetical protein